MRNDDLIRFYDVLRRLEAGVGGTRRLAHCDGRMGWPSRGVYFFFEAGEPRTDSGDGPRVVRVGTHALTSRSRTTLWNRLSQHRGVASTGGGNHRGSIFRLIVGAALMARHPEWGVETWGRGASAPRDTRTAEHEMERRVSAIIGDMPFLWLRLDDPPGPDSRRAYIERNAIALLSNHARAALDPPSDGWLGLRCPRERVRRSGLWNQQHVEAVHDPEFLPALESLIDEQIHPGART